MNEKKYFQCVQITNLATIYLEIVTEHSKYLLIIKFLL